MIKGDTFEGLVQGPAKKTLTPIRIRRPKTARRERHEVATRRETPTDSLAEYLATVIRFPSLDMSSKILTPGREVLKDITK